MKLIPLGLRTWKKSKSGIRGVTWHKLRKKWQARCTYTENGIKQRKIIGYFDTKEEAEAALIAFRGKIEPKGYAMCSDEDYDYLMQFSWCISNSGGGHLRAVRGIDTPDGKRSTRKMHHDIADRMGLQYDGLKIDHKDRNPLNNQRTNIRPATDSQNGCNKGAQKTNKLGKKGVCYSKRYNQYIAQLHKDGKRLLYSKHDTEDEAKAAYDKAAKEAHGEFFCSG